MQQILQKHGFALIRHTFAQVCACKSIANEKNFECTTLINKPVEVHGYPLTY